MDEPREIDWTTAVVSDGELTVELTGEPSGRWSEHMQGLARRPDPGRWARIKVTRQRVKVPSVSEDSVEELRHLLESAAHQANVHLVRPPEGDAPPAGAPVEDDAPVEETADADQALTAVFRALAPAAEDQHGPRVSPT